MENLTDKQYIEETFVHLMPHNEDWKKQFEIEKEKLEKIFETNKIATNNNNTNFDKSFDIEILHVGSTSINGLIAKPIIDIAIAVNNYKNAKKVDVPNYEIAKKVALVLENNNYFTRDKWQESEHFFVWKMGDDGNKNFHLHIEEKNSNRYKDHLFFRNFLNENEKYRLKYSKLKQKLAKKYSNDRKSYTKHKSPLIKKILKKAYKLYDKTAF